jgi:hypothetical protein
VLFIIAITNSFTITTDANAPIEHPVNTLSTIPQKPKIHSTESLEKLL